MKADTALKSVRDRLLLAGLGLLPRPLASHLLFLLNAHPDLADRWGYHVRPIHYYEPLPDFRAITAEATKRRRVSPAIEFNLDAQRQLVRTLGVRYRAELVDIAAARGFDFENDYFAGFDACMYYALIRHLQPRHVIEIGAGMSTRIAARALERNREQDHPGRLICIDPFPQSRLTDDMPAVTSVEQPVEQVPLEQFDILQANDILFIDSSHAVKFGGDVCREILEILPRLSRGVWIHLHDIFFPNDYPPAWVIDRRIAFNEQYLIEAFLAFNGSFAVRAADHWLANDYGEDVTALMHQPTMPATARSSSLWVERV